MHADAHDCHNSCDGLIIAFLEVGSERHPASGGATWGGYMGLSHAKGHWSEGLGPRHMQSTARVSLQVSTESEKTADVTRWARNAALCLSV